MKKGNEKEEKEEKKKKKKKKKTSEKGREVAKKGKVVDSKHYEEYERRS